MPKLADYDALVAALRFISALSSFSLGYQIAIYTSYIAVRKKSYIPFFMAKYISKFS